jgi:hypothetical protein
LRQLRLRCLPGVDDCRDLLYAEPAALQHLGKLRVIAQVGINRSIPDDFEAAVQNVETLGDFLLAAG